ncbi:methyltransferase [Rhodospirillaceae bacterium KN72]|uniref:Methyltransferase n=1 Tax=Pacificispira spongiicola TaxID=2729598 RepID=A0A7Y0HFW8_9PROT|nr:50S ribosomal protein L11 methyltransferase [Pacificispira spongiicola]NMM43734.1 methyltransferase [Pacificispira spongiicola]
MLGSSWSGLIRDNTRIQSPRLLPEMQLHLAQDDVPLYRMGEDELYALGIGTPYWAFAWAGGQALGRYLLDNPTAVRGRKVLDFGAGSGMVGIAAAMAGAFDVFGNDIDPVAGEAMRLNAELNDVHLDILTEDVIGRTDREFEVVLVGDVFYDKGIADLVLPWLRDLKAMGRTILIGDPDRFYLPNLGLERIARYASETTGLMEDTDLRNAGVWTLADSA